MDIPDLRARLIIGFGLICLGAVLIIFSVVTLLVASPTSIPLALVTAIAGFITALIGGKTIIRL